MLANQTCSARPTWIFVFKRKHFVIKFRRLWLIKTNLLEIPRDLTFRKRIDIYKKSFISDLKQIAWRFFGQPCASVYFVFVKTFWQLQCSFVFILILSLIVILFPSMNNLESRVVWACFVCLLEVYLRTN